MRELKFKYYFRSTDKPEMFLQTSIHTLEEIEKNNPDHNKYWECIGRAQYTGRQDKNGVELYESDILGINNQGGYPRKEGSPDYQKYVIVWDDDFSGWVLLSINSWSNAYRTDKTKFKWGKDKFNSSWKGLERIGNVRENPELLENGKDQKGNQDVAGKRSV